MRRILSNKGIANRLWIFAVAIRQACAEATCRHFWNFGLECLRFCCFFVIVARVFTAITATVVVIVACLLLLLLLFQCCEKEGPAPRHRSCYSLCSRLALRTGLSAYGQKIPLLDADIHPSVAEYIILTLGRMEVTKILEFIVGRLDFVRVLLSLSNDKTFLQKNINK